MEKKRYSILVVFILYVIAMLTPGALAADPGHLAPAIGSGQFESGNYTLPDSLNTTSLLEAGKTLFIDFKNKAGGNFS